MFVTWIQRTEPNRGSKTGDWGMFAYFCIYDPTLAAGGCLSPQELIHVLLLVHKLLQVIMFEIENSLHLTSSWDKKKENRFQRWSAGGVHTSFHVWSRFHHKNKTRTRSHRGLMTVKSVHVQVGVEAEAIMTLVDNRKCDAKALLVKLWCHHRSRRSRGLWKRRGISLSVYLSYACWDVLLVTHGCMN